MPNFPYSNSTAQVLGEWHADLLLEGIESNSPHATLNLFNDAGELCYSLYVNIFAKHEGLFPTAEELFQTAKKIVADIQRNPYAVKHYQNHQESLVP